jgi:hypothetical protein
MLKSKYEGDGRRLLYCQAYTFKFIRDFSRQCISAGNDDKRARSPQFSTDGSDASVYAIKQFTYLFPELSGKKLTVLQVNEAGDSLVRDKGKITELLQLHCPGLKFELLQGRAEDELFGYLLGKKNVVVVMGAFERNMPSGLFSHSTAEIIIKTINVPVFIAHHK